MEKILFALAILACTASVFACEGYIVSADGSESCFSSCGEAKAYARNLLQQGKKSVRIDTNNKTAYPGCNGKTYYSAGEIN